MLRRRGRRRRRLNVCVCERELGIVGMEWLGRIFSSGDGELDCEYLGTYGIDFFSDKIAIFGLLFLVVFGRA